MASFKLNHLHIKSPDPKAAAQWYVENLGAEIVYDLGSGFRLDLHGLPINLTAFVEGQTRQQHYGMEHVAIDTDDVEGVIKELEAKGGKVLEWADLPDGRRVCFFEGPDGVTLEVLPMA